MFVAMSNHTAFQYVLEILHMFDESMRFSILKSIYHLMLLISFACKGPFAALGKQYVEWIPTRS